MQNKKTLLSISILFLLLSTSLMANILTNYRINGIKNIEKQMDEELAQTKYWDNYLKKIDTTFGYVESYSNILVCDKAKSKLILYMQDSNNTYKLQKEYGAYTGEIKGDKVKEGDLRTPVGVYNLVKKIQKVDSFYGPMAFVTSYPNIYDKYKGKNGSGIWIHGLPTLQKRDTYTKGCIAINNKNIECLNRHIDIKKTLLIINENGIYEHFSKEQLSKVLSQLYAWRYSWIYNDIDSYLNFYDKNFIRFDGMNIKKFTKYKKRIFNKKEHKKIIFKNINVIPYPNTNDTYKVTFLEIYKSNSFSFTGNKVLIVKLVNDKIKIITEK